MRKSFLRYLWLFQSTEMFIPAIGRLISCVLYRLKFAVLFRSIYDSGNDIFQALPRLKLLKLSVFK